MNRRAAVQYLHERHPDVIDAPGKDVDLEALHLEVFWLQGHTCELMDERAEADVRRCFAVEGPGPPRFRSRSAPWTFS